MFTLYFFMKVPIYLVLKDTGQIDANGARCVIVIEAKLTRYSAELVSKNHPGSEIIKMMADKLIEM